MTAETPLALSMAWSQQLAMLEEQWTIMLDKCGGMARIKGTPLPIVYVSHLRTFLVISLLLYPYVWGREWGWGTIPIVALAAFCLLGIEAALHLQPVIHSSVIAALVTAVFTRNQ